MNEGNYFIFCCSSSKKKIWCLYFLKVPQGDDNAILNGGKTLRERVLENISFCEIHCSEDNL